MSETTDSINPVAVAEKSGLVYTHSSNRDATYILLQVKDNPEDVEVADIDLTVEGLDDDSVIVILEKILEELKNEKA